MIESDSDDDFKEAPKTSDESPQPVQKTGRKRVSKLVSKTFLDAEGYLGIMKVDFVNVFLSNSYL